MGGIRYSAAHGTKQTLGVPGLGARWLSSRSGLVIVAVLLVVHSPACLAVKEMKPLDDTALVANGAIVIPNDSVKAKIAAAQINSRIEEFGGQALPVLSLGTASFGPMPARTMIWLAAATDAAGLDAAAIALGEGNLQDGARRLKLTANDPGPQGYVIQCVRRKDGGLTCVLAGSDEQGMLYAAVTFRDMLQAGDKGVFVQAANVRDWPDFKFRHLGDPFEEPLREIWATMHSAAQKGDMARAESLAAQHVQKLEDYIDWLLQHKINMMGPHGAWSEGIGTITDWERGVIRRINEYALDRGIIAVYRDNIAIGRHPQDKDDPEIAACVLHPSHNRYYCWSRLEYHRKKAAQIAHYMRDCGYGALYLHDVDGGGWQNPALWDNRCELCRKTYGDDHAKADAVVFGIYYDAMRRELPDAKFFAVIYPYAPRYLNPDSIKADLRAQMGDAPGIDQIATHSVEKLRAFLERLRGLVADDWYICIRESERENVDRMREVWGRHPFYTYFEYMHYRGWQPWFSTSPRWTGTFYYPEYEDVLFGSLPGVGFHNPLRIYAAARAWDSRAEDFEPFVSADRANYAKCQTPRELAEKWAFRTSADLWGEAVAPYTVPLFSLNLATNFIFDPEATAETAGVKDVGKVMREQFAAARTCAESMHRLFDKILAGEITPKPMFYGELTNYYRFVVAAKALAGYRSQRLGIEEAITQGDDALTEERVRQLERDLEAWEKELAFVRERTKGLPIAESYARLTVDKGYLLALNVNDLRADIEKLLERKDELLAAYSIPEWFRSQANRREFYATLAERPVVPDGKLDEEVWRRAERIEHFVQYNRLRLGSRETVAQVAYDAENLYVAFQCFDSAANVIAIPPRDRDTFEHTDSVEVFVDPNGDRQTFRHYYVDLGQNVFDAARVRLPDGTLKYDTSWNGNLRYGLARLADRWVAELAIPVNDLGRPARQGQTWGLHLARNIVHGLPEHESVGAQFLDGESFHTVAKYAWLHFVGPESRAAAPKVTLEVLGKSLEQKVHEEGDMTQAGFNLRVNTDRSLHNVTVVAHLLDATGRQLLQQTVVERPWVELLWSSRRKIFLEVTGSHLGLLLELSVRSDEGVWEHQEKLGTLRMAVPEQELYAPGQAGPGDRALAAPMFCSSFDYSGGQPRHFVRSAQGTLECWLCPTEEIVADATNPRLMRTVVDIGPVRHDYPYLTNYRTIAMYLNQSGSLVFTITNDRYSNRSVSCSVKGWKAGEWRHVACQWRLDEAGKCRMQVFVNGRLAGDKVTGSKDGPPDAPLSRGDEILPIQVGAMNTGVAEAKMLIDELRFSLVTRYEGDFVPPKRLMTDPHTSLLFHFDGTLSAESGLTGVNVTGQAGTVG